MGEKSGEKDPVKPQGRAAPFGLNSGQANLWGLVKPTNEGGLAEQQGVGLARSGQKRPTPLQESMGALPVGS
jgi:hypothetical protein